MGVRQDRALRGVLVVLATLHLQAPHKETTGVQVPHILLGHTTQALGAEVLQRLEEMEIKL